MQLVADYFDVSVDYLLGREKDEYSGEQEDEEIRIMHRGVKNMTKEDREKALKCSKLSSTIGTNILKTSKGFYCAFCISKFIFKSSKSC